MHEFRPILIFAALAAFSAQAGAQELAALQQEAAVTCASADCSLFEPRAPGGAGPCPAETESRFRCRGADNSPLEALSPFQIAAAPESATGSRVCRQYLLLKAALQAHTAMLQPELAAASSAALAPGLSAAQSDPVCAPLAPPGTAELARPSSFMLRQQAERAYCRAVADSRCEAAGGVRLTVGGVASCAAFGVLLDTTCLARPASYLRNLAALMGRVTGREPRQLSSPGMMAPMNAPGGVAGGVGCLRELNPTAGQQFDSHFRDAQGAFTAAPKTKVCCGNDGCSADQPPGQRDAVYGAGARASQHGAGTLAVASTRYPNGTLQIFDGARLDEQAPGRQLVGLVFHEFLHRIGMCSMAMHNRASGALQIAATGGQCAAGYVRQGEQCRLKSACPAVLEPLTTVNPATGTDAAFDLRFRFDAVYGCQAACFPMNMQGNRVNADAESTCRRMAATAAPRWNSPLTPSCAELERSLRATGTEADRALLAAP